MENILAIHFAVLGLLLVVSFFFYKYPPKKINWLYGYRTPTAMQNQQTWDFANRYSAKWMLYSVAANTGISLLLLAVLGPTEVVHYFGYLTLVLGASMLAIVAATEWLLYQQFRKKQL